jgi:hypothetical protein
LLCIDYEATTIKGISLKSLHSVNQIPKAVESKILKNLKSCVQNHKGRTPPSKYHLEVKSPYGSIDR